MALKTSEYIELLNGLKVYFEDHRLTPGMGSLEELVRGLTQELDGKLSEHDFEIIISQYRTASQIQAMIDAATSGSSGIAHDLEQEINRAQSAEQQLSDRLTSTETAINSQIQDNTNDISDLQDDVSGIAHDLEQEINRAQASEQQLSNRVTSTETAINTLNGSGEGSVEAIAAAEVAKAVADAPAAFDTLKEIADWISAHADSASAMNSQIQDNTNDISDLQDDVSGIVHDLEQEINRAQAAEQQLSNRVTSTASAMNSQIQQNTQDISTNTGNINTLTTNGAGIKFGIVNGAYGYYDANNVFKVFKNQADTEAAYQSGYDAGYAAGVAATKVGTATAEEVLSGETFTNSTQVGASGSMVNRGSLKETINPGQSYTIPKGYHSGGGSVKANPNQNTGTYKPTTRGASIDMGVNNTYRYVNTTSVPNNNADTYSATSRNSAIDMGENNTYRYVNTTSVPNNNAETYSATSRNAAIDMGQTNTYRYVNTTKVPFNVKLINSDTSNAMKVNGYYYDDTGTKVTVTNASVAASGNVTYLCYSDDYQFTCSY